MWLRVVSSGEAVKITLPPRPPFPPFGGPLATYFSLWNDTHPSPPAPPRATTRTKSTKLRPLCKVLGKRNSRTLVKQSGRDYLASQLVVDRAISCIVNSLRLKTA